MEGGERVGRYSFAAFDMERTLRAERGEGDFLLFDWLNLKVAGDYADDDGSLASLVNDSENRVSVGLEPFLNRFLQPRLFYRVSNGARSNATHNQNVLLAEMHFFF